MKKKGPESVSFKCKCEIEKIERRKAENGNDYWVIKSTNGVRFVCFNHALIEQIEAREENEVLRLEGKLNFVMGSTYLNLLKVYSLILFCEQQAEFYDVVSQETKEGIL